MLPVNGKPLLHRLVDRCRKQQIDSITVVAGYRADAIEADGIRLAVNDAYEETGELASLYCARDSFSDDMVIMYGDLLFRGYVLRGLIESDREVLGYGLCLFHPDWHQGITGLVASRIRERTGRPTVTFARNESSLLTGSCRSIPGFHIKDALDRIAADNPNITGGILVFKADQVLAELKCDAGSVSDRDFYALFEAKERVGQCWNHNNFSWGDC